MVRTRAFDAVVFDFDGTLVDSNAVKDACFLEIAGAYPEGRERMAEILKIPGLDRHAVFDLFCRTVDTDGSRSDVLVGRFTALADRRVSQAPEIAGASALLNQLKGAGIPTFLSSATPLSSLARIVETRGWTAFFAGLHGRPADKLDTLRAVSRSLQVDDPARMAVVGDGLDDLQSARAFGCIFFGVGRREALAAETPLLSLDEVGRRLLHHEETNR